MKALRSALRAIVDGDGPQGTAGTMQNLCGRTTALCVTWRSIAEATLPVVGYAIVSDVLTGQAGHHREVLLQLSCFADGDGAVVKVEDMESRLRTILTQKAFNDNGADAAPVRRTAREVLEDDDTKLLRLARRDLDLLLNVKLA